MNTFVRLNFDPQYLLAVLLFEIGLLFNQSSMRLLYLVSYFMSSNLWQYSLNLVNVLILTGSFSSETKQTYDKPPQSFYIL